MSEVPAGAAKIELRAKDNTAPAFKSVNDNFKDFKKNLSNIEDNLKPFQEFLKGGVTFGGVGAGISAAINDTNTLASAFDNSRSSIEKLNSLMETSLPTKILTSISGVSGALLGTLSTVKQLGTAWNAARTIAVALNAAVYAQAVASGIATKASIAAGTAIGYQAWWSNALTVATNGLTAALGVNPFTAWIVAITATIAVIYGLAITVVKFWDNQKTAAQEATEQAKAMQEQHEKTRESCQGYIDRLDQLNQMEKQGKDVSEEKQQVLDELRKSFEGTGYTVDDLTGKVKDANGNLVDMKTALADIADNDISNTIRAISGEIDELNSKLQDGDISWGRWIGTWVTFGYMDNADEIKAQIEEKQKEIEELKEKKTQNRIDRDKPKIDEENKRIEEEKKEAEKRQAFAEKGLKLQADMQKTIRQETMSALEKELEAVEEISKARRRELDDAKKKHEITEESYNNEIAALDKLEQKRKEQVKAKYAKEAADFYISTREKQEKENREKTNKEEEKSLNQQIEENPFEALKTIQGKLTTANSAYNAADKAWQDKVKEATSDGFLSKEEKESIAKLEQTRAEAMARVEKMEGLRDSAQGKASERVEKAYNQALEKARKSREVNPVDTLMKGSVEAYKKELENANRGRTVDPTVVKLDELKKQMAAEAKEKADREKRTSDYVKKICESVGAV